MQPLGAQRRGVVGRILSYVNQDELAAIPEDLYRRELHAGLLVAEPWPFPRHGQVQARLVATLANHITAHRLGQALTDVGFLLSENPDTVVVPDVAFVTRARWLAAPDRNRYFPGAPDLAVEILSPSNRPREMRAKVAAYLAAGTRLVWVIDPGRWKASIHREAGAVRRVGAGKSLEGGDVIPGLSIDLDALLEH